jgi:hypothetical protein
MFLKKYSNFGERKKKSSDSEFLSHNLMLNSGKKTYRGLRDNKNKYSNYRVVRKKISERKNPP